MRAGLQTATEPCLLRARLSNEHATRALIADAHELVYLNRTTSFVGEIQGIKCQSL